MNILFIFNADISPTAAGGATGVTHLLAQFLSETYSYGTSLAYFDKHKVPSPIKSKFHITKQSIDNEFKNYLIKNRINTIIVSHVLKHNNHFISKIYEAAKSLNIKVIQWFHNQPGVELYYYGSLSRVLYSLKSRKNVWINTFYYFTTIFRGLYSKIASQFLKNKYEMRYENCDAYVLLSKNYIEKYAKIAKVADKSKFYAINNALRFNKEVPNSVLSEKQKEVLIIANLNDSTKRISLALKVWKIVEKQNQEWTLRIVGDGQDKEYCQYLVRKMNLCNVYFEGWQKDPTEYYKKSSIFLMTSGNEGWGLVLTEAQQMGVVPIAFNSYDAIYDIIQNGENGIIVKDNNLQMYAEQLMDLMQNDKRRQTMAKNALSSCQKFALPNILKQWVDLFNTLHNL